VNIFAIHDDPLQAGRDQHDRHVVKMTLETAQLLSTAVWHSDRIKSLWSDCHKHDLRSCDSVDTGSLRLYKSISNPNHPIAVWVRESDANLMWTILHMQGLIGEYHRRFRKVHACLNLSNGFLSVGAKLAGVERLWTRDENRNLIIDPACVALANQHSPFALAMPDYCKAVATDPVDAYRVFYLREKIFQDHVKWTRCVSLPDFITSVDMRFPAKVRDRVDALVHAHANQLRPPVVERVVAQPHVPAGMAIPSFLRNSIR
jgi:hypothetical protein